jgi:Na+-transporting methylmalonyl-CoA/oxaloacetate decarboxylase gamma subunit
MSYTATNFYNDETRRLNEKQQNANAIMNSQKRLAALNDSYRKRYSKYTEILIVLIVAFSINLGMVVLQKQFPTIPQIVFDGVFVVVLFLVIIYLFSAISELYNRSLMNYDEIDLPEYDESKITSEDANNSYDTGDILKLKDDTCVGSTCCPETYRYDPETNKCVLETTFTTLEQTLVENAYTHTPFNDPGLKRSQNSENVNPLKESTSLNYSTF